MKKFFFLAAVASLVLTACSSDNDEANVANSGQIRLTTQNVMGQTRSADQSLQLTQFAAGQSVSVFLVENVNGTATLSGDNVTSYGQPLAYTADGAGNLSNTQYWPKDGNGLFIYGVYPAGAATAYNATDVSFSVKADQSLDANYMASDLMTGAPAANPVNRQSAAVPLTFTHLLTKVNINLTAGAGFETDDMASATVTLLGLKPTTTFNVQNITVGTASGDATNIVAGTGAATSAIIVPQNVAAEASFIKVTVGGGDYIYKLEAGINFTAQKVYTFNLTISKTGLTLGTTSITPWASIGDDVVGEAELLPVKPYPMANVTLNDVGCIIASDGNIYDTKAAAVAAGVTAEAMIAYVGSASNCTHGLAVALQDVYSYKIHWNSAASSVSSWASSHTVTGGSWRVPSTDDWQYLFIGCGSTHEFTPLASLQDGWGHEYYYEGLKAKLSTAGGTALRTAEGSDYWTSNKYLDNNKVVWSYYPPLSFFSHPSTDAIQGYVRPVLYW